MIEKMWKVRWRASEARAGGARAEKEDLEIFFLRFFGQTGCVFHLLGLGVSSLYLSLERIYFCGETIDYFIDARR